MAVLAKAFFVTNKGSDSQGDDETSPAGNFKQVHKNISQTDEILLTFTRQWYACLNIRVPVTSSVAC